MPADLDVALLKLTSEDERCMTLSVQNLTCPVYDLDTNVLFEGMWQVHIEIFTYSVSKCSSSLLFVHHYGMLMWFDTLVG